MTKAVANFWDLSAEQQEPICQAMIGDAYPLSDIAEALSEQDKEWWS